MTSTDVNWTPPPYWYAPYLGAKDVKKRMSQNIERQMSAPGIGGHEPDVLKRKSCSDLPFWVDNGEPPPPQYEEVITPEILAALTYQHMQLPDTQVPLAPERTTPGDHRPGDPGTQPLTAEQDAYVREGPPWANRI
ncbi:hypothetical protein [Actinospica acidiphila]|uniref:hypothetical protein n=1 Tax=Actinospica acidiphila TaxID=304899 RepID=UPI001940AB40|nr:hypothetical protein [Actinospica acidiphila]